MSSRALRYLLATVAFFLLIPCSFSAEGNSPNFKSLYDSHRWFELRDAAEKNDAPAFYRGAVACAFNQLPQCEKIMAGVFNDKAHAGDSIEGHRILASAYLNHANYRDAKAQLDALLALDPKDSDALNDRPTLLALSQYPDQEIAGPRSTTVRLEDDGLPFSINGVKATYWFDTGAELSVLTDSEAKRFGLTVQALPVKVGDVNGTQIDSRVAIADEFLIGSVRLKHVAFLVVPDNHPPFNQGKPGSRGLIGLPVLLGLETFVWNADRKFEIGAKSLDRSAPHADLCLDGSHPVVQMRFEDHNLAFPLDTGATNTDLYPPFAAEFPELLRSANKTDSYKMEGVGGTKLMDAATLESVRFTIGGFPVVLKPAGVLLKPTTTASKFFDGNLGIDLLQQAQETVFDFTSMTLTLK